MKQHLFILSLLLSATVLGCHDAKTTTLPEVQPKTPIDVEASTDRTVPRFEMDTSMGTIVVQLAVDEAPGAVMRFLRHVADGVYDRTIFHRVLKDSMIQTGGYTPEFEPKEASTLPDIRVRWQSDLSNTRGTIALIRGSDAPTAQFFVNTTDNLKLDSPEHRGTFAVFGWVIEGMDTVDAIAKVPVGPHPKYADGQSAVVPTKPVIIKSVRLVDVPTEAQLRELTGAAMTGADQESIDDVTARIAKETGRKPVTTDTGLRYVDLVVGKGLSPLETDTIEFNYHGTLTDGTLFESTFETEPTTREVRALIPGLIEGVMSMKEHGRRKLIVPPDLGFGETGIPGRIPPDSILIFEVELLGVR